MPAPSNTVPPPWNGCTVARRLQRSRGLGLTGDLDSSREEYQERKTLTERWVWSWQTKRTTERQPSLQEPWKPLRNLLVSQPIWGPRTNSPFLTSLVASSGI